MDFKDDSRKIENLFKAILNQYPEDKTLSFKGKTRVHKIFKDIVSELGKVDSIKNSEFLLIEYSCGKGNWTNIPHLDIMDKRRTTTVQKGIYIVILFREDMEGYYLTLNQGVTIPKKVKGRIAGYEYLSGVATAARQVISRNNVEALELRGFSLNNDISLADHGLGLDYPHGTIIQKYFSKETTFSDAHFIDDISLLVDVYLELPMEEDLTLSPHKGYWIFQSNPELYDIKGAISTLKELNYTVSSYREKIKVGDQVFLWRSGSDGGIVGLATIVAPPEMRLKTAEEQQFYTSPEILNGEKLRVIIKIDKVLPDTLTKAKLLEEKELSGLSIFKVARGTNFLVTEPQAKTIIHMLESNLEIQEKFKVERFITDLSKANLQFDDDFILRFVAAICTKPFTILTGLSGSGKTKLALAFSKWITSSDDQICVVPVGADWTNREPLLGYPNALEPNRYVKPDTGVLDFLIKATKNPALPYFLILDEMNLSHVERYFADFLSGIESGEPILLRPDNPTWLDKEIPVSIVLPTNLFIIGTVNVDETTYMFSPKVLDRAGVLEFRVTRDNMKKFMENPKSPTMSLVEHQGRSMQRDFLKLATTTTHGYPSSQEISTTFSEFFTELQKLGAEFGYRTAYELNRFGGVMTELTQDGTPVTPSFVVDAGILQKLLPKVHGSRRKLEGVLKTLIGLCLVDQSSDSIQRFIKGEANSYHDNNSVKYPLSLEKLIRMHNHVIQDGFTSFSEA